MLLSGSVAAIEPIVVPRGEFSWMVKLLGDVRTGGESFISSMVINISQETVWTGNYLFQENYWLPLVPGSVDTFITHFKGKEIAF